MNERESKLHIIKEILASCTGGGVGVSNLPDLTPEELDRYQSYLLRAGLVEKTTGDGDVYSLRPTMAGETLLHLIDSLETLASSDKESKCLLAKEYPPMPPSPNKMAIVKTIQTKLLQAYVLEQAEVIRLETQLRSGVDTEDLIEKTEASELIKEFEERQRKLSLLQDFLSILPRLLGEVGGQSSHLS